MVTYLPISSPFIRFAGRFVDEAFGVAAGYNFFVLQAMLVPFEVVACNLIIHYWSDVVPAGGMIAIILFLYGLADLAVGNVDADRKIQTHQRVRCQMVRRVGVLACSWKSHLGRWTHLVHFHYYGWGQPSRGQVRVSVLERPGLFRRSLLNRFARRILWIHGMLGPGKLHRCWPRLYQYGRWGG